MSPQNQDDISLEPPAAVANEIAPSSYYIAPPAQGASPPRTPLIRHIFQGGPLPFMLGLALSTLILLGGVLGISHYLNKPSSSAANQQSASTSNSTVFGGDNSGLSINLDTTLAGGKNLSINGLTKIQPLTNSTKALVIQNSTGSNLLAADTKNMTITLGGNVNISGDVLISGQICTASGCFTPIATGGTAARGPAGARGIDGKNGKDGINGANGNSCGTGTCVSLQGSSPGVQETGNINISGSIIASDLNPTADASIISNAVVSDINSPSKYLYNDSVKWTALGVDGFLRIAYYNNTAQDLHYLRCTNVDCTTSVDTLLLSNPAVIDFASLAVAPDGFARLAYIAYGNPSTVHYIHCTNDDCTTKTDNAAASTSTNNLYEISMAVGQDGLGRLAYIDFADDSLHFVNCGDADCSTQTNTTVAANGEYSSIAVGSDGFARIAYEDISTSPEALKFIRCTNSDCSTKNTNTVAPNSEHLIYYITLLLDNGGIPRITYIDDILSPVYISHLTYVRCGNADCSASNTKVVLSNSYGVTPTLSLTNTGLPRIATENWDTIGEMGTQYFACNDANCSSFSNTKVSSAGSGYPISSTLGNDGFDRIVTFDTNIGKMQLIRLLSDSGLSATSGSSLGGKTASYSDLYVKHGLDINGSTLSSDVDGTLALNTSKDLSITSDQSINLQASDSITLATGDLILTAQSNRLAQGGLLLRWYNSTNVNTIYANIASGNLIKTMVDGPINWSDVLNNPPAGIRGNYVNGRWVGYIKADFSETYTFYTTSDDGSRLFINGNLIVDNWGFHGATEKSGTVALTAGTWYPIRIDYFQGGGGGSLSVSWSSPSTPKALIPADHMEYPEAAGFRIKNYLGLDAINVDASGNTISAAVPIMLGGIGSTNSTSFFQVQDTSGAAIFNVDNSARIITISGDTTTFASLTITNAHIESVQTNKPTISVPANCGTSPTASVTAGSTDTSGSFTINAGTGAPTTCDVIIIFNKTYGTAPKGILISPTTAIGGATGAKTAQVSAESATSFTIKLQTSPAASEKNSFFYWVVK